MILATEDRGGGDHWICGSEIDRRDARDAATLDALVNVPAPSQPDTAVSAVAMAAKGEPHFCADRDGKLIEPRLRAVPTDLAA